MAKTEIEFAGIKMRNPFVVASGPPGATVDRIMKCEDNGAGAVVTKLVLVKQPWPGRLRMYSVPGEASIVNHDRRLDLDQGLELVRKSKERTELPIIVNITHPIEDPAGWVKLAKELEQAGADGLELNLICPNISFATCRMGEKVKESHGAVIGQNPETVELAARTVSQAVKIPVIPKLTTNVADITLTGMAAVRGGAKGVCMAGGQSALPKVDIYNQGRPLYYCVDGVSHGSMGGPAILNQSFSLTAQLARALPIPVVAGGGISTWQDCIMFMMWGARAVTACTVIMWERFSVIKELVTGMERFLDEAGYQSIDEIIGLSLNHLKASKDLKVTDGCVAIDEGKCISCLKCVDLGHCDAIVEKNGSPEVIPEKCVACGICIGVCPQQAISMQE